jgi:spore coat protein SA
VRIALICSDRGPCPPVKGGAIQLLIARVAPYLAKHHSVTVFSIADPCLPEREIKQRVIYERYEKNHYFHSVCKRVSERHFDIIQVYNRPGWIAPLRERAPQAKIVLSLHNLVYKTLKVDREQAEDGFKKVDGVIAVSKFVARDTVKKFPVAGNRIRAMHTGVDLNEYEPIWTKTGKKWRKQIRGSYSIPMKAPVILFVGRLVSEKGCHLLLQAMRQVLETHKEAKLLIVGSKWYANHDTSSYIEELKRLAEPLKDSIIFTSYVPVENIPKYFTASDVFVCASQWKEPLARVHYEAMAAGLPIITTKRGGNHEVVRHGRDGIVINSYDKAEEFAKAAILLLENSKLARKFGKRGREKTEQVFNFKRVSSELLTFYKALFARKRGRA